MNLAIILTWFRVAAMPSIVALYYLPYPWAHPVAGLVFGAAALYFRDTAEIAIAALTVIFLLVTAPVAAHAIARAAYRTNVPLSSRTHIDEWKGKYGRESAPRIRAPRTR